MLTVSQQGLLNGELSVTIRAPTLELQQDSLALLLLPIPRSHGPPAAEQTPAAQQLLTESLSQDMSGYSFRCIFSPLSS
uniref:Uncharacterized protein n=1 Tax=Strigops habroptila TaxID=2489341 RepID=A0A672UTA2_STRHB